MKHFRSTRKFLSTIFLLIFIVLLWSGCSDNSTGPKKPTFSNPPSFPFDTTGAEKTVLESGVVYYTIEKGSGPFEVVARDRIKVHYTGRVKSTGKLFTSSYKNNDTEPDVLTLPSEVAGFREGLVGMQAGGKRKIIVPPDMGFQSEQTGLVGDTLVYDVKLLEIL